jgi:hypothetical protein
MSIGAIPSLAPTVVAAPGVETTVSTADGGTITSITEPNGVQEVISETGPPTPSDTAAAAGASSPGLLQRLVDSLSRALKADGSADGIPATQAKGTPSSSTGVDAASSPGSLGDTSTNPAVNAALHEFLSNAASASPSGVAVGSVVDGKA